MTAQFLQFVREELKTATADLSGATKGQLVAFAENAIFSSTSLSRGRKKISDATTGRMVKPDGPPMNGSQSRAKGSSIALVSPVEFGTATWRRAVLSLAEHQKAWLLWNYSENIRFEYQVLITQWAWSEFRAQLAAKKMAGKTMERLKTLIWLAAQDVKAELAGRDTYEYKQLAELIGVTPKNWSETFTARWEQMKGIFKGMDSDALLQVTRSRSQQKAANFAQSLAKLD